jgi:large subunit ribosomal protein L13
VSTDPAKAETKKSEKTKEATVKAKKVSAAKSESAKSEKKSADIVRNWHVVDAEGKILGKLAVQVANLLRGKHKPEFSLHVDHGDHVIIINAEKIKVTGKKEEQKLYRSHSGFPHGFKEETLRSLRGRRPEAILEKAVRGMIPHNRLGDKQFTKLKVYAGAEHPHEAQSPSVYEITKAS